MRIYRVCAAGRGEGLACYPPLAQFIHAAELVRERFGILVSSGRDDFFEAWRSEAGEAS